MDKLQAIAGRLRPYWPWIVAGLVVALLALRARSAASGAGNASAPAPDAGGGVGAPTAGDAVQQQLEFLKAQDSIQAGAEARATQANRLDALFAMSLQPWQLDTQRVAAAQQRLGEVQATIDQLVAQGRPKVGGRNFLSGKRAGAGAAYDYDQSLKRLQDEAARLKADAKPLVDPANFLAQLNTLGVLKTG